MRMVIVNPSLRLGSKTKIPPVGIASVYTYITHHGFDVELLDIDIDDLANERVEAFFENNTFDVVMTGSIVTHYKWMKWFTKMVKRTNPNATVIVGNSVGGSAPEVFLRNSGADITVYGEGEETALELLQRITKGQSWKDVKSICYIDDTGKFVKTEKRKACKVDELPMLNWDLFDIQKYFDRTDHQTAEGLIFDESNPPRVMPVPTARGCAFKCSFCHYVFWDDPYRHRSPESVIAEIRRNKEKYGATYINFWDDLSFSAIAQAERFVDALLEADLKVNWSAAIRADLLGQKDKHPYERRRRVAEKFKEAGCLNVGFSLESGSPEILQMMNKRITPDYFVEQVALMKEVGITVGTSVVFGYPIENRETINQTFDLCLKVGLYPSIGFLMPLPYTGMYEYGKTNGFITDEDKYLDAITERQDITLNMTKYSDQEIMDMIKEGAMRLNKELELGLNEDRLIRTGGYRNHTKKTARGNRDPIDVEKMDRIENDFTFNYSRVGWKELSSNDQVSTNKKTLPIVE